MSDIIRRTGIVSTGNSSSATLNAAGVFTGTTEEILPYAQITVMVKASHASATDGLSIQWSSDGTNFDDTDVFTIPANKGKVFTFGAQARYFRVVYTNGGTNQTFFRLHTTLKMFSQKPSTHRIQDMISTDDDAEIVKAIITGDDGQGNFANVRVDNIGRLLVSDIATTPTATTEIIQVALTSTNGTVDTIYTVTNGKTLTIQLFQAGAEANSIGGSKVALYEDPNGDLSVLNLVSVIYVNGTSFQNNITSSFTGNGTRRIVLRRTALAGASREIFGRWKGYEE